MRVHGVVELATAPKVAAVAASTAAIAGSGAATVHTVAREASPAPRASANPIELFEPARR